MPKTKTKAATASPRAQRAKAKQSHDKVSDRAHQKLEDARAKLDDLIEQMSDDPDAVSTEELAAAEGAVSAAKLRVHTLAESRRRALDRGRLEDAKALLGELNIDGSTAHDDAAEAFDAAVEALTGLYRTVSVARAENAETLAQLLAIQADAAAGQEPLPDGYRVVGNGQAGVTTLLRDGSPVYDLQPLNPGALFVEAVRRAAGNVDRGDAMRLRSGLPSSTSLRQRLPRDS